MTTAQSTRSWRGQHIVGIGEAMVEFAPVGDDLYKRGFAGDTLNTCWHMAQLLGEHANVRYCTRVGTDPFSREFVEFVAANGMDASRIGRDDERAIGLYVISLAGAERSFSYWRDTSAARRLADDLGALREALAESALIHVSGITLAVVGETGRKHLARALSEARASGAVVSFDPNVRLRLWRNLDELRDATRVMLEETDIALPSFDDEALVWGDADPDSTIARLTGAGVAEIAVKNGAGEVVWLADGARARTRTPPAPTIRDTTGAGDSFNSGYLAARFVGMPATEAIEFAQRLAGEVIGHFGALAPRESLANFQRAIRQRAER